MKATLVVLAVTATGFAAAATYVHRQLSVEQVLTKEEFAKSSHLEQRVRPAANEDLGSFRAAEAASAPLQSMPIEGHRADDAQFAVITSVRRAESPSLEPRQPPSVQLREEEPDSARMSLRLIRERIQEPGSR